MNMTFEELYNADFEITAPDVALQSWNDSHSYTGYQHSGRPYDGLMLITSDIRMEFSMVGGGTVTAEKNDLIYLPMGLLYTVRIESGAAGAMRIHDILFNFILRDQNGQVVSLSDTPLLISRDGGRFEKYFQDLSAAYHAPKRSMLCIKAEAYRLLRHVLSFCLGESEKRYPIRAGLDYLKHHWDENTPVSELAAMCGMSECYFRRLFGRFAGMNPVRYRLLIRISAAKSMLAAGDMNVGEVAEAVGFKDCFYFSRVFKSIVGVSPSAYARSQQK